MSTTRRTVEKEEGKEIKTRRHDISDPRFNLADENEAEKERRWFPLSSPSLFATLNRMNFSAPFQLFTRLFPCRFSNPLRFYASNARAAFNADTRQTHYFCTPRFVFWYHGRGWVVVARKREPRYVFFPLAFSARFLSLSLFFFLFLFWDRWKLTFRRRVWCCNSVTGENCSFWHANLDKS